MGLHLDIDLDDAFRNGHLEIEPLPHDALLHTPPQEDNAPVAGRDDDKGAPTDDEDDEEHNDYSKVAWLRELQFTNVYGPIRHYRPPLVMLYQVAFIHIASLPA